MSKSGSSSTVALATTLAELPHLSRQQLIDLWIEHMSKPPPKTASPSLLLRAVAYAVQERQLGGFKGPELRTLLRLGQPARSISRAPATARIVAAGSRRKDSAQVSEPVAPDRRHGAIARAKPQGLSRPPRPPALRPGTRLVREWQGKSHAVEVRADGFSWNGEVYRSLSAVALAITGARWSGNRFFRLDR